MVDRYKSTNTDATVRDFEGLRALVTLEDVSLNQIDADSFRFSHNTGQGEDYSELIDF